MAKKKKKTATTSASAGGGGGFGAVKDPKPPSPKQLLKRVAQTYGGTSPQQITQATQQRIQTNIQRQPPAVQLALQLYQQLQQWEARKAQLSLLQQAQLDPAELEGAARARHELQRLYDNDDKSILSIRCDDDLHNLLQQFTWDASADAKAARAVTGDMNDETRQRIERACVIVADAVKTGRTDDTDDSNHHNLCLDVGCGFGVLVPFLVQAGISPSNIHGVDLSPEMIRNAQEQHGNTNANANSKQSKSSPTFTACDFLNDYKGPSKDSDHDDKTPPPPFAAAIFCSSLHDFPHYPTALHKAASLLAPGGTLVVVHAQGASHVLQQVRQNPVLVQRGLPTAAELRELCENSTDNDNLSGLKLLIEPAPAGSDEESKVGYLAVLEKR